MSYLVTTRCAEAWPRLVACLKRVRGAGIAVIVLVLASPAIAEKGKLANA